MSTPGTPTPDPEFEKLRAFLDMDEEATGKSWSRSIVRRLLDERDALLAAVAVDPEAPTALRDRLHEHVQPMLFPGSDYRVKAIAWTDVLSVLSRLAAPVVVDPGEAAVTDEMVSASATAIRRALELGVDHTSVCDAWADANGSGCTCGVEVLHLVASRTTPTEQTTGSAFSGGGLAYGMADYPEESE